MSTATLTVSTFTLPRRRVGADSDYDFLTNEGKYLTSCLDLTDQSQHDMRDIYGLTVTIANTVLFCVFIAYFCLQWQFINHTFAIDKIRGEEVRLTSKRTGPCQLCACLLSALLMLL